MDKEKKSKKGIGGFIKKHKVLIIVLTILLIIGIVVAVLFTKASSAKKAMAGFGAGKETSSLTKMDLVDSVSATGELESADSVTVTSDLTNVKVLAVKKSVGDAVEEGDVICTLDTSSIDDQLEEAQLNLDDANDQNASSLASAEKQLTKAKKNQTSQKKTLAADTKSAKQAYTNGKNQVATAKSQYDAAVNARKALEGNKTSAEYSQAVTQEESLKKAYEEANNSLAQLKSAYEQAKKTEESTNEANADAVEQAQDSVDSSTNQNSSNIRQLNNQITSYQEQISEAVVKATASGTITSLSLSEGDTYSGGALAVIEDCNHYQITSSVDEYDIGKVSVGQRVIVKTDATDDDEFAGEITFVAPSTSSSNSSSSSSSSGQSTGMTTSSSSSSSGYEVIIKMTDTDDRLRLGMSAKLSIVISEEKDVFAVPYDAVHENSDGDSVIYVLDDSNNQSEVKVTKGTENDYYIAVSGSDLYEGMKVVIPSDTSGSDQTNNSDSSDSSFSFGGMGKSGSGGNNGAPSGAPSGGQGGGPGF